MAKRISNLADLDIEQEGMAQQDGLAERLARQRGQQSAEPASQVVRPEAPVTATPQRQRAAAEPNSWRRGKALLQVALPEDIHVELSIIAKRRRVTLSQITKEALNTWLVNHNYHIRIPD
jgi:hypothetical protein